MTGDKITYMEIIRQAQEKGVLQNPQYLRIFFDPLQYNVLFDMGVKVFTSLKMKRLTVTVHVSTGIKYEPLKRLLFCAGNKCTRKVAKESCRNRAIFYYLCLDRTSILSRLLSCFDLF